MFGVATSLLRPSGLTQWFKSSTNITSTLGFEVFCAGAGPTAAGRARDSAARTATYAVETYHRR
jgi:hypothetical protein